MRWLLLATAVLSASAFTVHQHSSEQNCVDLQCPAAAFDYGIRNLVSEETLRSDKCMSCQQCTANGYSLCLRMSSSRGRRAGDQDGCSCTHSVPANCHNQLSKSDHPANITMSLFHVCYLSALQAPPRPLAVNDKSSVIVTVESFWHEPYWRELQMENLTLHYEFVVQKPENCEGDVITNEGERVEHVCKNTVQLEMSGLSEEPKEDDDYDHSEDYAEYDDSLPPEVQFFRDVFYDAKLLKVFYSVQVRRPRQLTKENGDPFRDTTTTLESEVLKFDLKPEIYGEGVPELPAPTDDIETTETTDDEENVSDENGIEGTNFFEEDTKDTKSEEQLEREESELEKEIEKMDSTTRATTTTTIAETTTEEEEETTTEEEEETTTEAEAEKEESTEAADATQEETEDKGEEETADEEKQEESTTAVEEEHTTVDEETADRDYDGDNAEKEEDDEETNENKEEGGENGDKTEEEEEEDSEAVKTIVLFGRKFDKMSLSSTVFAICLCSLVLITLIYCCRRQICCCCFKKDAKTTSNGYRYSNPNRTNELVCSPEKERLHQ